MDEARRRVRWPVVWCGMYGVMCCAVPGGANGVAEPGKHGQRAYICFGGKTK
jgi:hypothetical protein